MMKLRKQYPVVTSAVILFKNLPEWRSHRWMLPPALAPERCLAFDFDTGPMLFQGLSYSRVTEDVAFFNRLSRSVSIFKTSIV